VQRLVEEPTLNRNRPPLSLLRRRRPRFRPAARSRVLSLGELIRLNSGQALIVAIKGVRNGVHVKGDILMKLLRKNTVLGSLLNGGVIAAFAIAGALALQAEHHRGHDTAHDDGKPETFIKEAANMNLATIKLGKLGSEKASSEELKEFASKLESDHKKIQERLEGLAEDKDVTMPTSLDTKHQEVYNRLERLSGEEFDTEFAKVTLKGHAVGVKKLERASEKFEEETELKEFVNKTLSDLKEHQEKAREVAKKVGLSEATIASIEREEPEAVGAPGGIIIIERDVIVEPDLDQEAPPTVPPQQQPLPQPLP
jgi:putative membrane protein